MRRTSRLTALIVALAVTVTTLLAQPRPTSASRPDLVVVISIDQFPYDYITRFQPYFGPNGFNRFLEHGANFTHALYTYSTTYTGPGHAAIGSGYTPSATGIVANTWFDRVAGAPEYCVADARATSTIRGASGAFSPLNLDSDSLGDRVQEKYPGSKVFGVSLKDRAAILMAGRKASSAYWYDASIPGFTSSSYYHANATLLSDFNRTVPDLVKSHPVWEQSSFIPAADLQKITHDPEALRKYKMQREGLGLSFPHPIKSAEAMTYTPYGNELVANFAEQLIATENLGAPDGAPDLLFISFSSPDYLGHAFGPDSLEAADTVVRTDREIARFLDDLETRFGNRVTVALTADHGVQSIPEVARDMGRDAGRVDFRNPNATARTIGDLAPKRRQLEKLVARRLGFAASDRTPLEKTLILYFEEPAVYVNWVRIHELKLDGERVKRLIRDEALKIKGISSAFTNSELLAANREASDLERTVRRSFRADRSGDVLMTLEPGYIWDYGGTGTTHGQPVEADQHVPVMLWGDGIKSGSYGDPAAPTDLARTLGTILGVEAGGPQSQVLPCVAKP